MKDNLPPNWVAIQLGELATAIQYGYTEKAQQKKIGPNFLRITDIQNDSVDWNKVPFCTIGDEEKRKYLLEKGDLVFARTGATVGKSFLITGNIPETVFASYLIRVRLGKGVEPKYISYFFRSADYWRQISESQAGIGQPNVNGKKLAKIKIPLAPPEQQKRIVAEIEKQFSRLDEAVANLKRVKANLKRYKAAVLKAAVEGKLTEEWRAAHGCANVAGDMDLDTPLRGASVATKQHPDVEPASKLLQRILAERRQKWEGKGKFKEPALMVQSVLPKLPEGWVWTQIETVTDMMSGHAFKKAEYSEKGVRLFQIANVSFGYTKWDEIEHLPESYIEQWKNLLLKEGDVLMALNRPLLSRELKIAKLGPNDVPAILYQRVGKFLFYFEDIADYFLIFMQSPYYINALESQLQGVNIPFINKGKLLSTPIPLPSSIFEMDVIVDKVKAVLSIIKTTEIEIENNLKRSDGLRQTILQKAFCGQLVQAEPGDEPASNILKRLKLQRDKKSAEPKLKKRGRMVAKKKTVKFERRKILDVLRESDKELSTAKLVELTGYPSDADPDTIEPFYLDLKKALDSEEIEYFRKGDFDYFRIKSTA